MLDQIMNTNTSMPGIDQTPTLCEMLPLIIDDVSLTIDGMSLIEHINLNLTGEHLTVVMGPNGAGKSLLLRLLHGLLEPTTGSITWAGKPLDVRSRKRQAMVFQRPVLLRRSVAANIDFVLQMVGKAGNERRDRLLNQAGLIEKAQRPARLLSGGEQQRLSLARALALEPDIMFLDEPTVSLDPTSVAKIEDLVREAHLSGTKIIFVTHDIAQAKRLAGDVVFLHDGRICEHQPAHSFFNKPRSDAARAYLDGGIVI